MQTAPWAPMTVRTRSHTWMSVIIRDQEPDDICLIMPVTAALYTGRDNTQTFQEYPEVAVLFVFKINRLRTKRICAYRAVIKPIVLMMYKTNVTVCSESHTKHINAM
jgi:hypothetical protein